MFVLDGGQLLGLHTHPRGAGGRFDEHRTGLDHVAFACRDRSELEAWAARLDDLVIEHGGIKDAHYGLLPRPGRDRARVVRAARLTRAAGNTRGHPRVRAP